MGSPTTLFSCKTWAVPHLCLLANYGQSHNFSVSLQIIMVGSPTAPFSCKLCSPTALFYCKLPVVSPIALFSCKLWAVPQLLFLQIVGLGLGFGSYGNTELWEHTCLSPLIMSTCSAYKEMGSDYLTLISKLKINKTLQCPISLKQIYIYSSPLFPKILQQIFSSILQFCSQSQRVTGRRKQNKKQQLGIMLIYRMGTKSL